MDRGIDFKIGEQYYAISGKHVYSVSVLGISYIPGTDSISALNIQIVGTDVVLGRYHPGLVFDSEFNARVYLRKLEDIVASRVDNSLGDAIKKRDGNVLHLDFNTIY